MIIWIAGCAIVLSCLAVIISVLAVKIASESLLKADFLHDKWHGLKRIPMSKYEFVTDMERVVELVVPREVERILGERK